MKKVSIIAVQARRGARKNTGEKYADGRPVYAKCSPSDAGAELVSYVHITLSNGRTMVRNPYGFQQDCQNSGLATNFNIASLMLVGCEIDVSNLTENTVKDNNGNDVLSYDTINLQGNIPIILSDKVVDRILDGKVKEDVTSWELQILTRMVESSANSTSADEIAKIRHSFYAGVKPTVVSNDAAPTTGKVSDKAKAILEEAAKA